MVAPNSPAHYCKHVVSKLATLLKKWGVTARVGASVAEVSPEGHFVQKSVHDCVEDHH